MFNREDWIMIKQMREKGCYLEDIAREMGVSSKTISRALHREGAPARRKRGVRPRKLDAYKAEIDPLLDENIWNAEVIYAHVREQGYAGSKTILREYIHPKRSRRKPVGTVRFETAPGEPLQHDWGELWTQLGVIPAVFDHRSRLTVRTPSGQRSPRTVSKHLVLSIISLMFSRLRLLLCDAFICDSPACHFPGDLTENYGGCLQAAFFLLKYQPGI
jgi:transposase